MSLPAFARRCDHIDPFLVMELVKKAAALEEDGHPIIHLSIGEPDFTAPEPVLRALKRATDAGRTQYSDAAGISALRRAIAADYHRHFGLDIDPSRVLITAGASGALTLACAALVNPGDGVLMSDPGYPCNRHFVAAFDGQAQTVPTGPAERFQLSAELVAAHWRANTRGVLISTPSNPTGTSMRTDALASIIADVRARAGFTIVDEIYIGLSYGHAPESALALADDIIVANSFSKYFHMTGWRLGWLVVPPGTLPVFEKLAQNLYICPSVLAQQAALACFEPDSQAVFAQRRQAFEERRNYLVPALREIGFEIPVEPDGAFYVYADISRFSDDSARFASEVLEQAHVSIVPGSDFGSNESGRYVRISYANSLENLRTAVQRLGEFVARRQAA
ncbi:MAG: pyridoxal phosphate-dependent aminotransferase [Burkholderiaceae bacterium]